MDHSLICINFMQQIISQPTSCLTHPVHSQFELVKRTNHVPRRELSDRNAEPSEVRKCLYRKANETNNAETGE